MNFLKSHFNLKFRRETVLHNCDKNTPEFTLEGKTKIFYRSYFKYKRKSLPFVCAKIAMSKEHSL